MIKTFKIFSMAAMALMMAACSSEDAALNNSTAQQQGRKVQFTATIAAPNSGAGTRTEYTEVTSGDAAGTINVAWKAGDKIALIHNGTKDEVEIETVIEDGSAIISGDITVGTDGEDVTAYYPAEAIELNSDKNPVPSAAYTQKILAQDGTLSYIASNLDLRCGESKLAVSDDKATLAASVSLASQIAIWKLSLNDGTNAISASQFVISDGSGNTITTVTPPTATSDLYIAMSPASEAAFSFSAAVDDFSWLYSKEGVTLKAGKYYQSAVTMTISKKAGEISYATTSVDKTFGDANFTNELTKTGDGTVTYSSSDTQVAEVNATTGEVTIKGDGEATITATVTDGPTYTYATTEASYTLSVGTATMTVTATGYSGTYDGSAHGITVNAPEGATIKYGTAADAYTLEAGPTYTTSGEYTVYYQVTLPGCTTVTGSATVTISKAAGSISYATATIDKSTTDAAFTNALTKTGDGKVTYSSDKESVAKVNTTTGEVTIMGKGEATITATVTDSDNYTYATKTATYQIKVTTRGGMEDYNRKDGTEW